MKKVLLVIGIIVIVVVASLTYGYYNIKPTIKLIGKDDITLKYNDNYTELGSKAEVLNKDITKNIKVKGAIDTKKVGEYEVEYTIKVGYLKNKKTIKRKIKIVDLEKPALELKGNKSITLTEGNNYIEPGYSALDEYDGDITENVKIESNLDNKKVGTYQIKYTATDSSGNEVSDTRTVIIKKKEVPKVVTGTSSGTGRGLPILMYHYFYDKNNPPSSLNSNYMEIHSFESQMKYLHDNNYYFPTWQEVADFVDGKITLPKKSVVITIDDGHKSLFDLAIPVLNKYNVKATAFMITHKDSAKKIPQYQSENINFQSHTHDMHKAGCKGGRGGLFRCISYDKGLADLKKSQQVLGSSDALAYPFGDITDNTLKITRASGFKVAVTIKYGKAKKGMDKLQLPRVRMSRGISLSSFKASL